MAQFYIKKIEHFCSGISLGVKFLLVSSCKKWNILEDYTHRIIAQSHIYLFSLVLGETNSHANSSPSCYESLCIRYVVLFGRDEKSSALWVSHLLCTKCVYKDKCANIKKMWAKLWTKWCHKVSEQSFANSNTHVKLQKGIDPKP